MTTARKKSFRLPNDPFEGLWQRGVAIGQTDIKNDEITFRFRKKLYTFPAFSAMHIARHNGYFYEASISEVKKLARSKH